MISRLSPRASPAFETTCDRPALVARSGRLISSSDSRARPSFSAAARASIGAVPGRIVAKRQREVASTRYPRSSAGRRPARTSDDLPEPDVPDDRHEAVVAEPFEQFVGVRLTAEEEQRFLGLERLEARERGAAGREP